MSITIDDKMDKIRQETTDLNWDDFKVFLGGKELAKRTVGREMSEAKRVIKNGITEENMYEKCPIVTRHVRHAVRRATRRINEYKKWVDEKCQ